MDHKKNIMNAIHKYHGRQLNQGLTREPKGKNRKPEKDTEKQVMAWGRENRVFLHVIEASTYNGRTGTFGDSKVQKGFSDIVGNTEQGLACYIELKAKDRRSNLSEAQREFLEQKIDQNCFAVVVDSRARLEQYWKGFWSLKNVEDRKTYLRDCLPKKRKGVNEDPLF